MSAQNCIMCTCVRLCAPHAPMDELWFRLHDELGICALPPGECRAQIAAGQKHTAAYGAASTHFQLTIIWFHRVFAIDGGSEQNIACSRWFVLLLHSATALCSTFLLFFVFGRCFAHCGSVFHHQHLRNNMFLCIWHSFFFFFARLLALHLTLGHFVYICHCTTVIPVIIWLLDKTDVADCTIIADNYTLHEWVFGDYSVSSGIKLCEWGAFYCCFCHLI